MSVVDRSEVDISRDTMMLWFYQWRRGEEDIPLDEFVVQKVEEMGLAEATIRDPDSGVEVKVSDMLISDLHTYA